jgi:hypothetical protein
MPQSRSLGAFSRHSVKLDPIDLNSDRPESTLRRLSKSFGSSLSTGVSPGLRLKNRISLSLESRVITGIMLWSFPPKSQPVRWHLGLCCKSYCRYHSVELLQYDRSILIGLIHLSVTTNLNIIARLNPY